MSYLLIQFPYNLSHEQRFTTTGTRNEYVEFTA